MFYVTSNLFLYENDISGGKFQKNKIKIFEV